MVVRVAGAGGVEKSNLSLAHILFNFEAKLKKISGTLYVLRSRLYIRYLSATFNALCLRIT
jgi:hypothetical protein